MLSKVVFFLILIFLAAFANSASGFSSSSSFWIEGKSPPMSLNPKACQAVVVDGKIFAIGGRPPLLLEMYNPDNDTWIEKAFLPSQGSGAPPNALVACGGKIYAIGAGNFGSGLMVYDMANDSWEAKTAMPNGVAECQAETAGGKIYVLGGVASSVGEWLLALNTNFVYDPANDSWSSLAPLPTPVGKYASAVVNDKIYVIGGLSSEGWVKPSAAVSSMLVQIFDIQTNSWSQGVPMAFGMHNIAGCTSIGANNSTEIFVIGGLIGKNSTGVNWTQIYDVQTNSWSFGPSLPEADYGLSLVNLNNSLYALGGTSGLINEFYKPAPNNSNTPPNSPTPNNSNTPPNSPTPTQTIPSPSVPEFTVWTTLTAILIAVIVLLTISKKRFYWIV